MLYVAMPEPTSVPVQLTGKTGLLSVAGSGFIWLTGASASTVFAQMGVWIGALVSKMTAAPLVRDVPVACPGNMFALKLRFPSPIGVGLSAGRNPSVEPDGSGWPVVGSSEVNCQVRAEPTVSMAACTCTRMLTSGRRSIVVLMVC